MSHWEFDCGFPSDYLLLPMDLLDAEDLPGAEEAMRRPITARLADDDPRLTAAPDELLPLLWSFAREAWQFGAVKAAVQVLDLSDTRYTAGVRVYHEDLTGAAAKRPGRPAAQAKVLARQLREPRPGDVSSREVEVVALPGGPAVRVSYRADDEGGAQAPSSLSVVLEVLEHWFPIDGEPTALVVEGRTSNLAHAGGMVQDLDRIAGSVRLYRP